MSNAALSIRLNGTVAFDGPDLSPIGLRLDRHVNTPARLTLSFGAAPGVAFGDQIALLQGGKALFTGIVDRRRTLTSATGQTIEVTASDGLARLAQRRSALADDGRSVLRCVAALLDDTGLSLHAKVDDFAIGRQVSCLDTDLAQMQAVLARYGLVVHAAGDGTRAILQDHTSATPAPIPLDPHLNACEEIETPSAAAAPAFSGWSSALDTAPRPRGAAASGRGPRAVPLREGEATDRVWRATHAQAARACLHLSATLTGLHDLWPGQSVGAAVLNASHTLSQVSLLLDAAGGPRTQITAQADAKPPVAAGAIALTGIVARIDDPEHAGRVQVRLPALDGLRTGWLTCLGAVGNDGSGGGLGLSFCVGDPVALLAPEGDPAKALVLGGLSRAGTLQSDLVGGTARRSVILRARSGQIALHEDDEALELSLNDGTAIRISPGQISLSASAKLDLSCDGRVRIRGSRIDFEEA